MKEKKRKKGSKKGRKEKCKKGSWMNERKRELTVNE